MQYVTLTNSNLSGAILKNVNLQFANISGCNWTDAKIDGLNLNNVYGPDVAKLKASTGKQQSLQI